MCSTKSCWVSSKGIDFTAQACVRVDRGPNYPTWIASACVHEAQLGLEPFSAADRETMVASGVHRFLRKSPSVLFEIVDKVTQLIGQLPRQMLHECLGEFAVIPKRIFLGVPKSTHTASPISGLRRSRRIERALWTLSERDTRRVSWSTKLRCST